MKVRALKDGTYAGYYRRGPTEDGQFPGEIFEIDPTPFEVRNADTGKAVLETDEEGKPIVMLDKDGKPMKDSKGKPLFKIKMNTWFAADWMEVVPEHTPITFDYPPFEIPIQYREKKKGVGGVGSGSSGMMPVHSPAPIPSVI